ncbi:hypothetical protein B0H16DRAFT_1468521 [Mycena metata]|uniref:Uncharacterized protein n=1 Tax=Mycena metata TaxID=1033252 RepID=A0AAD7I0V8_9AGAR|nr:hypothetical protein B0H16DRAFT_1468521 [Mycena metata]
MVRNTIPPVDNANHQVGDKSTEDSDANEDEGLLNFGTEPREQNTEARQEPAHDVDHDPNPAELRVPSVGVIGSGFIHHIIGGLQRGLARGLVIETENVDAELISPFSNRSAHVNIAVLKQTDPLGPEILLALGGAYVAGGCGEHSLSQAPQPNLEISMGHRGLGSVAQLVATGRPRHPLLLALVFSLLTYIHTLKTRTLLVANTPGLRDARRCLCPVRQSDRLPGHPAEQPPVPPVYTAFGLLVVPGYITYKRRTLNLEAKVNQQWSQELGAAGRLIVALFFLPSLLLSSETRGPPVWRCVPFFFPSSGVPPSLPSPRFYLALSAFPSTRHTNQPHSNMAAGLLCSNHGTYRFGKGMMPKAYRLSREAMAVIMEQYASQLADQYGADAAAHMIANNSGNTGPRAQTHTRGSGLSGLSGMGSGGGGGGGGAYAQMPPNPFSPNPTPAASASDLNLAGPRPHHDEDGEGEGGIRMGMAASRRATSEGVGGNMRSTSHWISGRRGGGSELFFFFCVVGLHRGRGAGVVVRLKSRGIALG